MCKRPSAHNTHTNINEGILKYHQRFPEGRKFQEGVYSSSRSQDHVSALAGLQVWTQQFAPSFLSLSSSIPPLCEQKNFFCTGAPSSILPSRKPAHAPTQKDGHSCHLQHTRTHTHTPSCHPHHMHAPLPPATPAEALGLSHLLPAPAVSPSLPYPPSQHMQPLPWVRWSGHQPGHGPRGGGEGVHV